MYGMEVVDEAPALGYKYSYSCTHPNPYRHFGLVFVVVNCVFVILLGLQLRNEDSSNNKFNRCGAVWGDAVRMTLVSQTTFDYDCIIYYYS